MKVFYDIGFKSYGIERVITALEKYQPAGIERVHNPDEADLVILHVIGRHDHRKIEADKITARGQQYAIIQYALKSTRNPNPADWMPIWKGARVVWSYYNLPTDNLYLAPLAASPETFYPVETEKKYLVGTLGVKACYASECYGEVHLAAFQARGKVAHVGEKPNENPIVTYYSGISDDELRTVYNQCQWFAALRRKDGFEIPAIEALLCGVHPILFDTPNYRQWFDGLAEFVPECSPGELVGRLKRIFLNSPRPVTVAEMAETKARFNWERAVGGFWERCGA